MLRKNVKENYIKVITSIEDIRIVDQVEYKISKLDKRFKVSFSLGHVITWYTTLPEYEIYLTWLEEQDIMVKTMKGTTVFDKKKIESRHECLRLE